MRAAMTATAPTAVAIAAAAYGMVRGEAWLPEKREEPEDVTFRGPF